jgi:ABC-type transport system involved in cytochrome bd biosynthesis fused ATPase/permease subunit
MKNKTRVLFANSIANLQKVDKIYILEKGKIVTEGKFCNKIILILNYQLISFDFMMNRNCPGLKIY